MKKLLLALLLIAFYSSNGIAQSIVPNSGVQGQTLQTTITLAAGSMFGSSGPMGYQDIYLQQAGSGTTIFCDPSFDPLIDWYNYFDPWMGTVYTDSGRVTFNIPGNAPNGYYSANVVTYNGPFGGVLYSIPNAFFIGNPAGTIQGSVYFDLNQNGSKDVGEPPMYNQQVQFSPGNVIAFTNSQGEYNFYADTGTYTSTLLLPSGFTQTSSPLTYTSTIPPSVTGQDFGIYSPTYAYNHSSSIYRTRGRCNTNSQVHMNIRNRGLMPIQDRVTLITSSNYVFISSTITPDYVNGDTIRWNTPIINTISNYTVGGTVLFMTPAALQMVTLTMIDSVFDGGGNFIEVVIDTWTYQVSCAYDPNDKHVNPEGVLSQNFTPIDAELTYLINFQNTGNDTAYDVFIFDTLDADLDFSTLEVVESSHELNLQMTPNGELRFNFFNIMLPDSGADEPASHGWVLYRIRPNTGIADPTEITNTSYIVFDLNAPIVTNTTLNTMTALQYPQSNFTTADVTICETNCILFSNQSVSGSSYLWNFQGGSPTSSTNANPGAICYSTSGTYDVTLITTNALGSDTLTQSAYINVAPSPAVFSVVQAGDSLISPQGYDTYQWYYDNIMINGATSYFYIATLDGDYGVVVGNANGCQTGVNITNVIIGIDDLSSSKAISVYPNPTSGQFEISFNSNDNQSVTISIFDKVGQMVLSRTISTVPGINKLTIEEQNLSAGVYTIQVAGNSAVFSKLLLINK